MKKPKLFLVCTGLGIVKRGFESYVSDLANHLQPSAEYFSTIVYSGGKFEGRLFTANKLFCISRNNSFWIRFIGRRLTAELELASFFISLLVRVIVGQPAAIYLGEYKLYCYLFKTRKIFRLDFSLVLYTGGQVKPGLFDKQRDFVHHVTDIYVNDLTREGFPIDRQYILPHFLDKPNIEVELAPAQKLKQLAKEKKIIISVGVIDKKIKRMDKFVQLLSYKPNTFFPVIVGEYTNETPQVTTQLNDLFGYDNYYVGSLSKLELYAFLSISDAFILFSPKESFGLAAVEALSVGLPVICCDFYEAKFVLKDQAFLVDGDDIAGIRKLLDNLFEQEQPVNKSRRISFVNQNYSWEAVGEKYIDMFRTIITHNS